jgi:hypothetical protein
MKLVLAAIFVAFASANAANLSVKSPSIMIELTGTGEITGAFSGGSVLEGCQQDGPTVGRKFGDVCTFTRTLTDARNHRALVTDRFTPTRDSIRWEVEVVSEDAPWTTPVEMRLKFPANDVTRFWTSWIGGEQWSDPLTTMPLANRTWDYGNGTNTICIPVATVLHPATDSGTSLIVSPSQPMLWTQLSTTPGGEVIFRHKLLRFGGGKKVTFTADIVMHEADWRGGLRWMVARYPEYFNPPNPRAAQMAGTGSYSRKMDKLTPAEIEKFKQMAYRTDWDASFNWPYFGMFMPPMPSAEATWQTYGYDTAGNHDPKLVMPMSYRRLNDKARDRKAAGFFTLAYFNVTEFGVGIRDSASAVNTNLSDAESWRDANTFLHRKIADGIYRDEKGNTIGTWGGAIVTDPAGPDYQRFLIAQVEQLKLLPDFDGIAIDRMDWLARVNYPPSADDKTGWYADGRPGQFLGRSWKDTLAKIGPVLHRMDKTILVNCNFYAHRLDYMRDVDGFYDEQGDNGYDLNGSSLLALRKPAIMWTHSNDWIKPDPDSYFQRHLYMGAFPSAPFPGNDHMIQPDPKTDRWYLDYGPLLDVMRGKKWVLAPHAVECDTAKVNLFEVPGGYVLPVTFGKDTATVHIRNVAGLKRLKCEALHPGLEKPVPLAGRWRDGALEITVPLVHGCAVVRLR